MRNLRVIFALSISIFCTTSLVYAADSKPIIDNRELAAYVKELRPQVESITGKKFKSIPKYKLATAAQMRGDAVQEWYLRNRNNPDDVDKKQQKDMLEKFVKCRSESYLGLYKPGEKKICIFTDNIKRLADRAEFTPEQTKAFTKLVIAHELAHAMQDQIVGFRKTYSCDNSYLGDVLEAVTEGHSRFVERKIAESLGVKDLDERLETLPHASSSFYQSLDVVEKYNFDEDVVYYQLLVKRGREFITWHYNQGGNDQVWKVLSAPPKNLSVISHPETYGQVSVDPINYGAILSGLEKRFINSNYPVENVSRNEIEMRSKFSEMDADTLDKLFAELDHAQKLEVSNLKTYLGIRLYVFKNPESAQALLRELETSNLLILQRLHFNKAYKVTNIVDDDYSWAKADTARKITSTLIYSDGTKTNDMLVWVLRDNYLVQVGFSNIKSSESQVGEVIKEIFSRLDKANSK